MTSAQRHSRRRRMEAVARQERRVPSDASRDLRGEVGIGRAGLLRLRSSCAAQEARVLVGDEDQRLDGSAARRGRPGCRRARPEPWGPRCGSRAAGAEVRAEAPRRRLVRRVVGADDHARRGRRPGRNGSAVIRRATASGRAAAGLREVRHARAGPAVADDVHRSRARHRRAAARAGREASPPRGRRPRRRWSSRRARREAHLAASARRSPGRTMWLIVEARMGGQELHAPQAHQLDGDHAGEGAGGGAEEAGDARQPRLHVGDGTRSRPIDANRTMSRAARPARHRQPNRRRRARSAARAVGPGAARRAPGRADRGHRSGLATPNARRRGRATTATIGSWRSAATAPCRRS